jgi:hypothetical protein
LDQTLFGPARVKNRRGFGRKREREIKREKEREMGERERE